MEEKNSCLVKVALNQKGQHPLHAKFKLNKPSFGELKAKSGLQNAKCVLVYIDVDGHMCKISSDQDLKIALDELTHPKKLLVQILDSNLEASTNICNNNDDGDEQKMQMDYFEQVLNELLKKFQDKKDESTRNALTKYISQLFKEERNKMFDAAHPCLVQKYFGIMEKWECVEYKTICNNKELIATFDENHDPYEWQWVPVCFGNVEFTQKILKTVRNF